MVTVLNRTVFNHFRFPNAVRNEKKTKKFHISKIVHQLQNIVQKKNIKSKEKTIVRRKCQKKAKPVVNVGKLNNSKETV